MRKFNSCRKTERTKSRSVSGSDGSAADRFDFWTDLRVDVGAINFRPVNPWTNDSGYNSAWIDDAGNRRANAWNGRSNPRYRSSDSGKCNSGNHPEHDHRANSADGTYRTDSGNNAQHAGNDAGNRNTGCKSKRASSGTSQSSEQHSPDYNTTNNA